MSLTLLWILIGITAYVSYTSFQQPEKLTKRLFIPYKVVFKGEYQRLLTGMFIHADWPHLLFNMMSLYFLGSVLILGLNDFFAGNEFITNMHFVVLYFIGGMFANLYPLIRHQNNPNYRALGASGAVSAVIFATILWNPSMELMILFLPFPIPAYIFGPLYLAFEYYSMKRGGSGIAHDAHIGGAIFGVIYVLIINIDKGKEFLNLIF